MSQNGNSGSEDWIDGLVQSNEEKANEPRQLIVPPLPETTNGTQAGEVVTPSLPPVLDSSSMLAKKKENNEVIVINTQNKSGDGINKCPSCGSSDISYDIAKVSLICNFCRTGWNENLVMEEFDINGDITHLKGIVIGSGSTDIISDVSDVLTIKCSGCGADVVIKTAENLQSRCHWCRQVLSINNQIPNGSIPDAILPFSVSHSSAVESIRAFVDKRRFFAKRQFINEFQPENVVGVYMPYMVIDANMSAEIEGVGQTLVRKRRVGSGDSKKTVYDADEYYVARKFDAHVDDLISEASQERADYKQTKLNTNNVINAILPFDTKSALVYNANYIAKFTSEKRDLSIPELASTNIRDQLLSISRSEASQMSTRYDRGVRWTSEDITVHGSRWVAMYLPVWLYSYYIPNTNGNGGISHYIAVNGRTGKTMGSVPANKNKITAIAFLSAFVTAVPTWAFYIGI